MELLSTWYHIPECGWYLQHSAAGHQLTHGQLVMRSSSKYKQGHQSHMQIQVTVTVRLKSVLRSRIIFLLGKIF
jgi:hypothetical protein